MNSRLDRWLSELLDTPGLTAIRDLADARRALLDDALRGVELVRGLDGPIVDVGSGGGTPGIPLARGATRARGHAARVERAQVRVPAPLGGRVPERPVVEGRAEEQPVDGYGVAVAKALAPPVVAAEWCLPLVRPGGAAILWVGPNVDVAAVARAAGRLGGGDAEARGGLLVLPKLEPTPAGFPRRPGMARKRPLA